MTIKKLEKINSRRDHDDNLLEYVQPRIPKSSHNSCALSVQSASAMSTEDDAAYSSPNWSHAGFMDLQCPHLSTKDKNRDLG